MNYAFNFYRITRVLLTAVSFILTAISPLKLPSQAASPVGQATSQDCEEIKQDIQQMQDDLAKLSAAMEQLQNVLNQTNKDIAKAQADLKLTTAPGLNETLRGQVLDSLTGLMSTRNHLEQELETDAKLVQVIKDQIADLLNKLGNCAPPNATQPQAQESPQNQPPSSPPSPPPSQLTPSQPSSNKSVSMSGFTPTFQLRGFGGASFINGNTPATSGFDGAVLFPLGNHILVGPTAGFNWINSSLVNSIGSHQPGSTFINTAAGFKSGNFGAQIQIPFMFFHPTGVHIDIHAGATVANSTITQAEGFCGLGNATSPAGCNVTSTTTTHNTVIGPFLGGYISHSIFPHVGVFAGYHWIHLKDTSSGGSTTGSSGGSQTLFDLNQNEIKLGIEIRIPITTHPPVLVSPTSTSPR